MLTLPVALPQTDVLRQEAPSLPAYFGEGDCLRSTLCSYQAQPGGSPCAACSRLRPEGVHHLKRTAERAANAVAGLIKQDAKHVQQLTPVESAAALRSQLQSVSAMLRQRNAEMADLQEKHQRLAAKVEDKEAEARARASGSASHMVLRLAEDVYKGGELPCKVL